jgi:beta-glucanase (GH16 family)
MSRDRCRIDGQGHLVQTVLAGEPFQGGSIQSKREFGYGRWVARVKPSSVPGVLNSIFTKDWDDLKTPGDEHDGKKAEVDFEFVTHTFGGGKGEAHLAIHLKGHTPLWHLDIPLDFDPSQDFHEWGFDILPDRVVWHVDGKVVHTWLYTDEHFVDPDYEFFFNSWSRAKWLKGPPATDADYLIDWVKFYPFKADGAAPTASKE